MTQLYTSMAHTKIALANGGAPPPVMQFSKEWRNRLDMKNVLGLGALIEDKIKGLKCPFAGCERWCHSLAPHVRAYHGVTSAALKEGLGLPPSMSLLSQQAHDHMSSAQRKSVREGRSGIGKAIAVGRKSRKALRGEARKRWKPATKGLSVAARNWRGSCRAQLGERLKQAVEESGATNLTQKVAIQLLGYSTFKRIVRTFGSWNIAKQSLGLPVRFRIAHRLELPLVVTCFRQFESRHGRFPTAGEAQSGHYSPLLPSYNPILRATKASSWAEATRKIRRALAA